MSTHQITAGTEWEHEHFVIARCVSKHGLLYHDRPMLATVLRVPDIYSINKRKDRMIDVEYYYEKKIFTLECTRLDYAYNIEKALDFVKKLDIIAGFEEQNTESIESRVKNAQDNHLGYIENNSYMGDVKILVTGIEGGGNYEYKLLQELAISTINKVSIDGYCYSIVLNTSEDSVVGVEILCKNLYRINRMEDAIKIMSTI